MDVQPPLPRSTLSVIVAPTVGTPDVMAKLGPIGERSAERELRDAGPNCAIRARSLARKRDSNASSRRGRNTLRPNWPATGEMDGVGAPLTAVMPVDVTPRPSDAALSPL